MCANSKGSGETARWAGSPKPSLAAYVKSTITHELTHLPIERFLLWIRWLDRIDFPSPNFGMNRPIRRQEVGKRSGAIASSYLSKLLSKSCRYSAETVFTPLILDSNVRAPDKMRICVFHSNLNVKNSIIFGNVRIMYAKHFPDTQLCPVSKRIYFVCILMECGLLPIFP